MSELLRKKHYQEYVEWIARMDERPTLRQLVIDKVRGMITVPIPLAPPKPPRTRQFPEHHRFNPENAWIDL